MYTNPFIFILILMFKHTTIFRDIVKWSFHNGKITYHASGVILLWAQTIGVRGSHPLFTVQYKPFSMCPCYKTFLKGLNMKKQLTVMTLFHVLIFFFSISCGSKTENHVTSIVQNILYTKTAIEDYLKNRTNQQLSPILFASFWDFDGTILKGDCSEGLQEENKQVYKGLVQVAIENNFSKKYKYNEYNKFLQHYAYLETHKGHSDAYIYLATLFTGRDIRDLQQLSQHYFSHTLHYYFFASSIAIMNQLKAHGIKIYIISASPDYFVKGAAYSLNLSSDTIYGIKVKTNNGIATEQVIPPLTYAEGKTKLLKSIIDRLKKENKTNHVYAIAAFGNSYHTDGNFLYYVATQTLPAGKPVSVMINGGSPPKKYHALFECVIQNDVIAK